jgi:phosphopantothenoylcysteine synthetase/decarboxylase
MKLLITAGNTLVLIDRVRCLTNIFTGRTGAAIALEARRRGHTVTLLTSHGEAIAELGDNSTDLGDRWHVHRYRTFEDLQTLMERAVSSGDLDGVVHSAAVSDYLPAGVYAPAPHTHFRPEDGSWESSELQAPALVDRRAGKVKSDEPELWLRLVRAPKLIDRVRTDWSFQGVLVKFKLEVGVEDAVLLDIAERSRNHSAADLCVANTLEGASTWAFLGPVAGAYQRVSRRELAPRLLETLEKLHAERTHG